MQTSDVDYSRTEAEPYSMHKFLLPLRSWKLNQMVKILELGTFIAW
jgi:hypothetical protein